MFVHSRKKVVDAALTKRTALYRHAVLVVFFWVEMCDIDIDMVLGFIFFLFLCDLNSCLLPKKHKTVKFMMCEEFSLVCFI